MEDIINDESCCFGAIVKPVGDDVSYETSKQMWMYRAFNGVLYDRSKIRETAPDGSKPCPIHKGDHVRIELDFDSGTISFGVNGSKPLMCFDSVESGMRIYPAVAFCHRNGVKVRLIKVERGEIDRGFHKSINSKSASSMSVLGFEMSLSNDTIKIESSNSVKRLLGENGEGDTEQDGDDGNKELKSPLKRVRKRKKSKSTKQKKKAKSKKNESSCDENMITDWITVRATSARGGILEGHHVWYITIKNLTSSSVAVGITTSNTKSLMSLCLGDDKNSWALHSDLSLWYGGRKRGSLREDDDNNNDEEEDEADKLELDEDEVDDEKNTDDDDDDDDDESSKIEENVKTKKRRRQRSSKRKKNIITSKQKNLQNGDIIKVTLDCCSGSRQLSFALNGESLGVAFGAKGSGAAVELSEKENLGSECSEALYPAVSLLSKDDYVSFHSGGLLESHTMSLPWLVDILRTCTGLGARLAATMVAGEPTDTKEVEMEPWLQSPLLASGLEEDQARIILEGMDDVTEDGYNGFVLPMSWQIACSEANRADSPMSLRRAFSRGSSTNVTTPPRLKKSSSSPLLQLRSSSSRLKDAGTQVRDKFLSALSNVKLDELSDKNAESARVFMKWLREQQQRKKRKRRVAKESPFSYIERLFVAVLLKHSGLWDEAAKIATSVRNGKEMTCSAEMEYVWHSVSRIQKILRRRKQLFRNDTMSMDNDETKSNEEMHQEQKSKDETRPQNFEEYCSLVASRAKFLLQVVPCTKQNLKDNKESLSQLAAKWRSVLPPPTLEPLLARWKSVDVSNDKWRGVISVLRTQKALKKSEGSGK